MKPGVALILSSKLDNGKFLPLARQILGYSPAAAADSLTVELQPLAHHIACVAAFKDEKAACTVKKAAALDLMHVGFLIVANERDMVEILEVAGMSFVLTETLAGGITAIIISGSVAQWQRAVKYACDPVANLSSGARAAYNSIYRELCDCGLKAMFNGLHVHKQQDETFLLESRR